MITKIQIDAVNELCSLSKELNTVVDMNTIVDVVNAVDESIYDFILINAYTASDVYKSKADIIKHQIYCIVDTYLCTDMNDRFIEYCKLYYIVLWLNKL